MRGLVPVLVLLASGLVRAQDPSEKTPLSALPKGPPPIIRQQEYFVPFEEIEAVFQKTGRGIFLPYEEFLELWNRAHVSPPPPDDAPPADAVIQGGTYEGRVADDIAQFQVTYTVEALKKGWSALDLPLRGVAVQSLEASDPDVLFAAAGEGYRLFLPRAGKYELQLRLSATVSKTPGKKSLHLGIPATAVSRLDLTVPEENVRVDIQPSLAVTQTEPGEGATRILAFLGNATGVTVSWMPPAGRVADGGAILYAKQAIRTHVGPRILRITTSIEYDVLRGEVDTLRIRMPSETRLLSVEGENMRAWEPEGDVLTVQLHSALPESYRLDLSFERILEDVPPALAVPFPRILDVLHESGLAVLGYDDGLRVRIDRTEGLSQLDPEQIPDALLDESTRVGFRYLAQPLALELGVTPIVPQVRSETTSVIVLGREEDQWTGWIDYSITKAGLFRLGLRVPESWDVDSVGTVSVVEDFQRGDPVDGQRTITVSLRSKALGDFRLPFRFVREGTAAPGEIELTALAVLDSSQDRGLLGVSVPRSVEAITLERTNVVDAHTDELFGTGIMGQISSDAGLPRSFRYREQPARLRLRLEDKKTEIDVLAQHLVEVTDGEIRLAHFLDYNVLYAPVTQLRFRAPSSLDETLNVQAKNMTQCKPAERAAGVTTWEATFQPPVLGAVTLTLNHTIDLPGLRAGEPASPDVPLVHAVGVRGEQGFVAIRKDGTLEIVPRPDGMEAIDAVDLPDKLRRGQIYSAFRYFTATPTLALDLTRYEYDELATTIVPLLRMRSLLSPERKLRTQAVFFVQNAERQYLELQLPAGAEILFLSVNGQDKRPRNRPNETTTLVDLPESAGAGGTFAVLLDYEVPTADSDMGTMGLVHVETPQVLQEVPVQKIELELYLPSDYAYMGWSGNLHRKARGGGWLWSRFRGLLGANVASASRQTNGAVFPDLQAGFRTPLPVHPDDTVVRLETLAPHGEARCFFMGWSLFWFLDFLLLVGALVGSTMLLGRGPLPKLQAASVLLLAGLVLYWFSSAPASALFGSLLAGVLIVCAAFLLRDVWERWSAFRAARVAFGPDPFIEEAPRTPARGPAPEHPETSDSPGEGSATDVQKTESDAEKPDAQKPDAKDSSRNDTDDSDSGEHDSGDAEKADKPGKSEKKPRKPRRRRKPKPGEES